MEQQFEANPEEQKQIGNMTRICFAYLGQDVGCHVAHMIPTLSLSH
jgi:hypothetical protein